MGILREGTTTRRDWKDGGVDEVEITFKRGSWVWRPAQVVVAEEETGGACSDETSK